MSRNGQDQWINISKKINTDLKENDWWGITWGSFSENLIVLYFKNNIYFKNKQTFLAMRNEKDSGQ